MTKNKKKKLKKKAKKQRELLESQLAQMEGLTVDANAIQEVLNSAPVRICFYLFFKLHQLGVAFGEMSTRG